MRLKKIILSAVIINFCVTCSISQEVEKELISQFLNSLFDDNVPPSKVVDYYMIYSKDSKQYGAVTSHIQEIRRGSELNRGWLMPNYKIERLQKHNIKRYVEFEALNKINLELSESNKLNTYVLINEQQSEILQYFLLEKGKIKSFTLFGKGNEFWFFGYD